MVNPEHSKINYHVSTEETRAKKRVPPVPKSRKDFQRVLRKDEKHGRQDKDEKKAVKGEKHSLIDKGEEQIAVRDQSKEQQGSSVSLFDLSRKSAKKSAQDPAEMVAMADDANATTEDLKAMKTPSPFDLGTSAKSLTAEKDAKFPAAESVEGNVAPMGMQQGASLESPMAAASAEKTAPVAKIQEIINQVVDKVTSMQTDGKSETTITLKNHPLLQGAKVVITEFDTARGEFNISFQGLTQAGKGLLDVNQDALRQAFDQKGFTVHILTTTTIIETRETEQGSALARDSGKEGEEQEKEGKREKKEDEETA